MKKTKYKINITELIDKSCDYYDLDIPLKNVLCEVLTEIMRHSLIDRDVYETLIIDNEKYTEKDMIKVLCKSLKEWR